jgi:hypothetical protein
MNGDELFREYIESLEKRIDKLERTLEGMQILLGKASEYKARPKREKRLPR